MNQQSLKPKCRHKYCIKACEENQKFCKLHIKYTKKLVLKKRCKCFRCLKSALPGNDYCNDHHINDLIETTRIVHKI